MSLKYGILFNDVLRLRLLINLSDSCYFINLDFLLPHIVYFDNNTVLSFLVFNAFELPFSLSIYFFALQIICQHVYNELCLIYQ